MPEVTVEPAEAAVAIEPAADVVVAVETATAVIPVEIVPADPIEVTITIEVGS